MFHEDHAKDTATFLAGDWFRIQYP